MSEWSGSNGTHWGLIGERFALLIERSVSPDTLNALAAKRSVEEIIDTLIARGIEHLPGFCLVGFSDSRVTAYLRGGFSLRVEASWHDALTETGQQVRTWREISVDGVSRFAMFGPDTADQADLPIRSYDADREHIVYGVQGLAFVVCERLTARDAPLMTTTTTQEGPATHHLPAPPVTPEPARNAFDELFGGPEPSNPAHDVVHEDTVLAGRERGLEDRRESASQYVLILPDGEEVAVSQRMLVGRNPKEEVDEDAQLVPVIDPNGNISRTHARLTVTDDGVCVEDLGSTNGTVLVTSADEIVLTGHTPRVMQTGDRIILGGDAQLEIRERVI